jgi:hypothetical protein
VQQFLYDLSGNGLLGIREKGEGRREKGEGRREKGIGRREKGEGNSLPAGRQGRRE